MSIQKIYVKKLSMPDLSTEQLREVLDGKLEVYWPSKLLLSPPNELIKTSLDIADCLGWLNIQTGRIGTYNGIGIWYQKCRLKNVPAIYMQKWKRGLFKVTVDLITCEWKVDLKQILNLIVDRRPKTFEKLVNEFYESGRSEVSWAAQSGDLVDIYWLEEGLAQSICSEFEELCRFAKDKQ